MEKFAKKDFKTNESSRNYTVVSLILTAIIWICFSIFSVLYRFESEPVYKPIKIMLEPINRTEEKQSQKQVNDKYAEAEQQMQSAPEVEQQAVKEVVKPQETAPAQQSAKPVEPAKTEPQKTQTKPAETKPLVKPQETKPAVKPAQSKPAESKPATKPQESKPVATTTKPTAQNVVKEVEKPEPVKERVWNYKKTVEEMMEEMDSPKKTASTANWDNFDENATVSSSSNVAMNTSRQQINTADALKGTAASSSTANNNSPQKAVSENKTNQASASSATTAALNKITATRYNNTVADGISTKQVINTGRSTDGKFTLALSDGSSRVMLYPAKPQIHLSEEAALTIDSSRTVTISFEINTDGSVPRGGISVTPSASLTPEVKAEVFDEVSTWRFASANSKGIARFEYSIIKN